MVAGRAGGEEAKGSKGYKPSVVEINVTRCNVEYQENGQYHDNFNGDGWSLDILVTTL